MQALCREAGALYIADEVQTGLGRTGRLWGVDNWGVVPDILVTGKGLSGGLYPVSATILSERAGAWLRENGWGHVSTFGGSDVGCIVARRALEMCADEAVLSNVRSQSAYLVEGLEALARRFPFLEEVRHKGLVMGLRFADCNTGLGMMRALYENGIWAIVAGYDESVVQFKPGLLIDREYCDEALRRIEQALAWYLRAYNELLGGADAPDAAQLEAIVAVARQALASWQLAGADLELVKHRENTVFRAHTRDGRAFALRVHQEALHGDDALHSELEWMRTLRQDGFRVPAVVPANDGELFVAATVGELTRRCSLLEWIDGDLFNELGLCERGMQAELCERYRKLGALAARLHVQATGWTPPAGFTRHAWDEDALLGDDPRMGRFWEHPALTPQQRRSLLEARAALRGMLRQLGKTPDNYGLIHGDFLPDNLIVAGDELALIDFDDCGYGWHLYEMATGLFPQVKQPFFDDLVNAYLEGYRQERALDDAEAALLPAFIMICGLNYLGWLQKRGSHLRHADRLAEEIIEGLSGYVPDLLQALNLWQRLAVNVVARLA